jgi:hypothetical protein
MSLVVTGAGERAGEGLKVGRSAGVGQGIGGSGSVNGSLESLSEDGDLYKSAPVLEVQPPILVVDFMTEGDVNVLQRVALRETRSLVSRSQRAE